MLAGLENMKNKIWHLNWTFNFFSSLTLGDLATVTNTKLDKKRQRLVIEDQLEIVRRFENGEKQTHIAKDLGINKTLVHNIIKRRDKLNKFKDINQAFGSSTPISQIKSLKIARSPTMEIMERLLAEWIGNCNQRGVGKTNF